MKKPKFGDKSIRVKFPLRSDNEADLSGVSPWSSLAD